MNLHLVVAHGCTQAGELLRGLLREKGVRVDEYNSNEQFDAFVSYGCRIQVELTCPVLNANAGGSNKFRELSDMQLKGVRTPLFGIDINSSVHHLPVVARRYQHTRGTDIRLIRTRAGVRRWASERDFWTKYIPIDQEYRVQIFRKAHLGTYRKVHTHPELQKSAVARNLRNGWTFELMRSDVVPREAVDLAKKAIWALDLDFGGVDIIKGQDGLFYVLEVNTACGAEDSRQWLQRLAHHIVRWTEKGFPPRSTECPIPSSPPVSTGASTT